MSTSSKFGNTGGLLEAFSNTQADVEVQPEKVVTAKAIKKKSADPIKKPKAPAAIKRSNKAKSSDPKDYLQNRQSEEGWSDQEAKAYKESYHVIGLRVPPEVADKMHDLAKDQPTGHKGLSAIARNILIGELLEDYSFKR